VLAHARACVMPHGKPGISGKADGKAEVLWGCTVILSFNLGLRLPLLSEFVYPGSLGYCAQYILPTHVTLARKFPAPAFNLIIFAKRCIRSQAVLVLQPGDLPARPSWAPPIQLVQSWRAG
jgi:hypothetical protein